MLTFDKLGEFYLGKSQNELAEPVLLSAKDLTTHAFIVGMTGSGKTGLAIDLLEEALIDDVPVIAIDPKGDLANLALQFPDVTSPEAAQWLSADVADLSTQQAHWQKLRGHSELMPTRIAALRDKLAVRVFTPGNADGLPINTLPLSAPPQDIPDTALEARANAISTALLHRIGESADTASPAQVYIANVLLWYWRAGRSLDLAALLSAVQTPPMDTIGMLDVAVFFPDKDRHALMLKLNTLIAAPGFKDWLSGPALDVGTYLAMGQSKVPVTIFSIAHLSEDDRQFFVQLLLAELITWMRQQSGSTSLRALLYMDEIYGYIPPVENPPTKRHFLTLLKQARAYGVGLALATQNPVDLDYKGLSNIGTWMIGRLQTQRDRDRLLDGLQALRGEASNVDERIAGLGKREFLLHSVHRAEQTTFYTRCTQALLVGPLSIRQLREIPGRVIDAIPEAVAISSITQMKNKGEGQGKVETDGTNDGEHPSAATPIAPPAVNPRIPVRYHTAPGEAVYQPQLAAQLTIFYQDKATGAHQLHNVTLQVPADAAGNVDWSSATLYPGHGAEQWQAQPIPGVGFADLPRALQQLKPYTRSKTVIRKVTVPLATETLLAYPPLDLVAELGETEMAFRTRVGQAIKSRRDELRASLQAEVQGELSALQAKRDTLETRLAKEKSESLAAKINSWAKAGGAILAAFVSNKKISVTNANRASSTVTAIGRARKQAQDVKSVKAQLKALDQEVGALEDSLAERIGKLEAEQPNLQQLQLSKTVLVPRQNDIEIMQCFLAWV